MAGSESEYISDMFFPPLPPPDPPRISAVEVQFCPGHDPKCYFERWNDFFEPIGQVVESLASRDSAAAPMRFDDIRQAIIDGLVSDQSEATGWNAVRYDIPVSAVVRTSDTVVTITLPPLSGSPAVPGYHITAPETITATVPACAVVSGASITATPPIVVRPAAIPAE